MRLTRSFNAQSCLRLKDLKRDKIRSNFLASFQLHLITARKSSRSQHISGFQESWSFETWKIRINMLGLSYGSSDEEDIEVSL
jgi:hypothetical protein